MRLLTILECEVPTMRLSLLTLPLLFTLSLACGGTPATDAPATDAPATDAPATDTPATDAPEDPPDAPVTFKELDPELRARFRSLNKGIKSITDAASFEKQWNDADSIAHDLEAALDKRGTCSDLPLEGLGKQVGMEVGCIAEATAAHVMLTGWADYATKTKDEADDHFVSLMMLAYEGGRLGGAVGWSVPREEVELINCSALGTGKIFALFQAVDAMGKGHFEKPVAEVRAKLVDELMGSHLPYCTPAGSTPDDALKDEAKKILAEIELSPEEKKKLEAVIPKLKGEADR